MPDRHGPGPICRTVRDHEEILRRLSIQDGALVDSVVGGDRACLAASGLALEERR
jgi:hypothetical protein